MYAKLACIPSVMAFRINQTTSQLMKCLQIVVMNKVKLLNF